MFCQCYLLSSSSSSSSSFSSSSLTVTLETNYLRISSTDLRRIFRIGIWADIINQIFVLRSLKVDCHGNRFWARIGENLGIPPPSVHWHSTVAGRIASWMHVSLSAIAHLPLPAHDFGTVYLMVSSLPHRSQHFVVN